MEFRSVVIRKRLAWRRSLQSYKWYVIEINSLIFVLVFKMFNWHVTLDYGTYMWNPQGNTSIFCLNVLARSSFFVDLLYLNWFCSSESAEKVLTCEHWSLVALFVFCYEFSQVEIYQIATFSSLLLMIREDSTRVYSTLSYIKRIHFVLKTLKPETREKPRLRTKSRLQKKSQFAP